MGAPFWSDKEKQYFLDHIVPRSHYAKGYYDENGRSFQDLAEVMQRDMDERGWSRRQYSGDLLFQHWYQKIRPFASNTTSSSTQGPNGDQGSADLQQYSLSVGPRTYPSKLPGASANDLAANPAELTMTESISRTAALEVLDKSDPTNASSSPPRLKSASGLSPPIHSVIDPHLKSTSVTELPDRLPKSPSTLSSSNPPNPTPKKRTYKAATGRGGRTDGVPPMKSKRAKKATANGTNPKLEETGESSKTNEIHVRKSPTDKSEDTGQLDTHGTLQDDSPSHNNPLPPVYLTSGEDVSPKTQAVNSPNTQNAIDSARHGARSQYFGPPTAPGSIEEVESQFRLRQPAAVLPNPPHSFQTAATTARDVCSTPYNVPHPLGGTTATHPRAGLQSLTARRGGRFSENSPFMHAPLDEATGQRQMMGIVPPAPSFSPTYGPATASLTPLHPTPGPGQSQGPRIDPTTRQRLGEVTLQGTTLMTYCPSCQRPF
jgi:hypothetical protein